MSPSALFTMLVVQVLVSAITFYFLFQVMRKKRPNNSSDSQEQF
ncbi:hypothetical protein [Gracilimonas sp.]